MSTIATVCFIIFAVLLLAFIVLSILASVLAPRFSRRCEYYKVYDLEDAAFAFLLAAVGMLPLGAILAILA